MPSLVLSLSLTIRKAFLLSVHVNLSTRNQKKSSYIYIFVTFVYVAHHTVSDNEGVVHINVAGLIP